MKKKSQQRRSVKRKPVSRKRPARPYRWLVWPATAIVVLAAVAVGWRHLVSSPRQTPISTVDTTPAPKSKIEALLASLPERPLDAVSDIKAEELALAEAVVADAPHQADALCLLATVFKGHGDIQQAETLWKKALTIDPARSQTYEDLGLAAQAQDRLDDAVTFWRRGLEANPQSPSLRWHIANAQLLQGQLEGTIELLETECRLTPGAARNYFLLGQIHLKKDEYDRARTCYEKALELQPDYPNAYYGLGKVYMRLGQREKATACMDSYRDSKAQLNASDEQRIVLDELPSVRSRAAAFYRQSQGFYSGPTQAGISERLLRRAVTLDPNDVRTWEKLAAHHYQQHQFQRALTCFEKARDIDPNNPLFHINIATLYTWLKQPRRTEAYLKETIARFPNHALARAELARFYLHVRANLDQALVLAEKAVALGPTAANYFTLARACEAQGDLTKATEAIRKAMTLAPNDERYQGFYAHIRSRQ